ncbi:hypothetical protein N656DRAFT_548784 [Canariomyces notabilis]|uniref:Ribosome biogenesis protein ALB1 n=1 Tax=Canariomyces notabilis TaxID=2074819 RepID=A0AAN6TIL7_9PEZI|nr:hypothetical protein N656DRAFT_548784 [Canariomyces arenarius]
MPSVKNPNAPSKNRLAARAAKQRKQRQKAAAAGQLKKVIAKGDMRRGARPGLLPTSGPRKPVSAKRQRKLERKMGYALKRKMEAELAEGEVVMKDVDVDESGKVEKAGDKSSKGKGKGQQAEEQEVEMDIE